MRKFILFILTILGMFTLVSCNDNDNETNKPNYEKDYLVKNVYDGKTIYNETVVLINDGNTISGNLLYEPTKIIEVKDYKLTKTYDPSEYEIIGRTIKATSQSTMPYLTTEALQGINMPENYGFATQPGYNGGPEVIFTEGFGIVAHQISITYEHDSKWNGFTQQYKGELLPKTIDKLAKGEKLNIVFNGDSIMTGCNCSSKLAIPPYLEDFPTLICNKLRAYYKSEINMYNTSVGGKLSSFGRENVDGNVNIYNPDLVIIGYGMNDGSWNINPLTYQDNIEFMIQSIKSRNENAEIILVSTILANPLAVQNSIQPTYLPYLQELEEKYDGVALVDMTSFSTDLYKLKNSVDVLANNINHPSDFLVRCYVDNILRAIIK